MSIIYKTTNLLNGKIYVGKHHTSNNDGYLGSGLLLNKSIKKYGKENFKREILEQCAEENVNERERYWIKELDARNSEVGYNITVGGDGFACGKDNPFYGKHHTEENKKKISESERGKIISEETKKKMWLGRKRPEHSERMKGENNPIFGKPRSEETKRKMKESRLRNILSKKILDN